MTDDHDRFAVIGCDGPHVLGRSTRGQTVVDRGTVEAERRRRLPRAQKRARHHRVRDDAFVAQPVAELPRLGAALGRQRPELVGVAGCRLRVSNDDDAHPGQDSLGPMAGLGERYLLLGLRLGRHIDGLVDAYFGPPELAAQAEAEALVAPEELAGEAADLAAATTDVWLRAQLVGCETTARRLAGEEIGWIDEVERCYGVPPQRTDEAVFEAAHERLASVLPGDGDLGERYRDWTATQELPAGVLLQATTQFTVSLQARTAELFGLPDDESAEIELVRDEPWSAFNYYLGRRRSRVAINTDLPVYSFRLPELVAHEIYPGHHTEHAWKEALLVDGQGNFGETIFLVGTPQSTISEGIASLAPEVIEASSSAQEIYDGLGVAYDAATADSVVAARADLGGVGVNAALMLHVDGRSRDEVVDYLARRSLMPREHAEKRVEFITHPTWRAYISCYESGYELCKRWVAGDVQRFRRLLTEQLSTSDLSAA